MSLSSFIPLNVRKNLAAQITPLSKDSLPEPADLEKFWVNCETAIASIHPSTTPSVLSARAILNLAPVLLGPACWAEVRDDITLTPMAWDRFKDYINDLYGLSEEDLSD